MRPRLVALVVLAAALLTACGVRVQDEPAPIDRRDVPFGLLEPRSTETDGEEPASFVVYFERADALVAVPRVSATPATPEAVVEALLRGPTLGEAAAGLQSAVPPGTELQAIEREGGVVTVELTPPFAESADLATALRQVDSTLLELPGVEQVRVLVEGVEISPVEGTTPGFP